MRQVLSSFNKKDKDHVSKGQFRHYSVAYGTLKYEKRRSLSGIDKKFHTIITIRIFHDKIYDIQDI